MTYRVFYSAKLTEFNDCPLALDIYDIVDENCWHRMNIISNCDELFIRHISIQDEKSTVFFFFLASLYTGISHRQNCDPVFHSMGMVDANNIRRHYDPYRFQHLHLPSYWWFRSDVSLPVLGKLGWCFWKDMTRDSSVCAKMTGINLREMSIDSWFESNFVLMFRVIKYSTTPSHRIPNLSAEPEIITS